MKYIHSCNEDKRGGLLTLINQMPLGGGEIKTYCPVKGQMTARPHQFYSFSKKARARLQNNSTPNAQSRAGAIATPAINMCTAMRHRKGKKPKLLRKYIEYKHSSCEFAAKCVPV